MQKLYELVHSVLVGRRPAAAGERRRASRIAFPASLRCHTRQGEYPATLIDLTPEGLRLRTLAALAPGMAASISAAGSLEGRQLQCQVAWANQTSTTEAGLVYTDTTENLAFSWVQMALHRLHPQPGQRRSRRIPVELPCTLEGQAGVCLDLGTGGARLRMPAAVATGTAVRLGLSSQSLRSRVVSCRPEGREFLIGLRFQAGENKEHHQLRSLLLSLLDEM